MPDQLVKKNATLNDTIELIRHRINTDCKNPFVQQLVKSLYSPDPETFCKNLFDYVCRNVRYQLDPRGTEFVYRPETTVVNGIGDCKKMTTLIGSALKAYGIDPLLKHVFYKGEDYTHIYPIVPRNGGNYLVLDPVNDRKYNSEVRHDYANVYNLAGKKMDLFTGAAPGNGNTNFKSFKSAVSNCAGDITADLSTIGGNTQPTMGSIQDAITEAMTADFTVSGIGRKTKQQRQENRKKALEKIKGAVKKVGGVLATGMRAAALLAVSVNVRKLATNLTKAFAKDPKKVEDAWKKFGGDPNALKRAMLDGARKSPVIGERVGAAGIAVTVATALPIITAFIKIIKDAKVAPVSEEANLEQMEENAEDAIADGDVNVEESSRSAAQNLYKGPIKKGTSDKDDDTSPPPTPPAPTVGSTWINQLDTPSDWVGAILKSTLLVSGTMNAFPQYATEISVAGFLLFVGYIVKLKFLK